MSDWQSVKLSDLLELKYGKDHKHLKEGNYPAFGSGGIMRNVETAIYDKHSILIPRKGSLNNIFYVDTPFWTVDTIFWSKIFDEKVNGKFLFYSLKLVDFENLNVGSAVPSLTTKVLNELQIELPPLPEQQAIASVLSSLDDKIDLLHRQNKTLEAMVETLFRQWFIEEAKDDWEIKKLADIANIFIGRTPPRKESHWFSTSANDVKWISIKDMASDGCFVNKTSEFLSNNTISNFTIPIIPKDTVVLSFKMTVGRVKITNEDMVSNEAIAQFQIKDTKFSKEWLYCYLKKFNYDVLGTTSSIVTSINTALIKGIEIPVPDDKLIKKFNENSFSIFEKIRFNQIQIQTLENLRDTLLPKLMSGEIRV